MQGVVLSTLVSICKMHEKLIRSCDVSWCMQHRNKLHKATAMSPRGNYTVIFVRLAGVCGSPLGLCMCILFTLKTRKINNSVNVESSQLLLWS